ncbi:peptide chain release factor N(5)-glutamine methyltransferase [Jannaschia sp. CCS1]|uniref:peptide chain release factor N(5)-glutamine methyltransferase n=1 Tax=Jannaschia sp. (strain CCS1) TaxID=290400 RepID=UPI000053C0F5|nr:peptide chain release factor N(5)-glutamine methyltransferase [Jannaschia sp. CCS1]ABD54724.1 [protein release factor]-glutamine N5-methyltransferase [Jannaschia sp. CCS1]
MRHSLELARKGFSDFLPDGEAEREARLLMCHALKISSAQLYARLDETWPTGPPFQLFVEACEARKSRQPLSQIIGEVEFYGRRFFVNSDVLTPRPDTETLVDQALSGGFERVLDLGTGSGCVLATLLAERPGSNGVGTDLSQPALEVAARNVARQGVQDRAVLVHSDWFEAVQGQFDLILSNPPYIAAAEMRGLAPEVRDWEPHVALTPGGDGLTAYRIITAAGPMHLRAGGRLMVEIGLDQGAAVAELFRAAGFGDVRITQDLSGHDRVVGGITP